LLWREIYEELKRNISHPGIGYSYIRGNWEYILKDWHVEKLHRPADEYTIDANANVELVKKIIVKHTYNLVFDFLTFVIRHNKCPYQFEKRIDFALKKGLAAYEVVSEGPTIIPRSTVEQGDAIRNAFSRLSQEGFDGARVHLQNSADALNAGDFAGSIRESVHSVESVARTLNPDAASTLAPALNALEEKVKIHPALKEGFKKLYGYTSDENGIRHALLEGEVDVDSDDAIFMIGACASFVSYLIGKARGVGMLNK